MDEIEPVAFHPANGTPGAAEELGIAVVEVVQIAPQLGFGGSGAAQCLAEESRVCNDAPADHDAGKGGKFRFQRMELPCGGEITVVADRRLALGQGGGKGLPDEVIDAHGRQRRLGSDADGLCAQCPHHAFGAVEVVFARHDADAVRRVVPPRTEDGDLWVH